MLVQPVVSRPVCTCGGCKHGVYCNVGAWVQRAALLGSRGKWWEMGLRKTKRTGNGRPNLSAPLRRLSQARNRVRTRVGFLLVDHDHEISH